MSCFDFNAGYRKPFGVSHSFFSFLSFDTVEILCCIFMFYFYVLFLFLFCFIFIVSYKLILCYLFFQIIIYCSKYSICRKLFTSGISRREKNSHLFLCRSFSSFLHMLTL